MKTQIKEIRVKIDGLSQLTKELKPSQYVINAGSVPEGVTLVEIMELLKKNSTLIPLNNVEDIKPLEQHEISKSCDSLILAKAWLGKMLGELGEETPYKNDGNRKSVEDIEPTADRSAIISTGGGFIDKSDESPDDKLLWREKSHIEKVDWLRQEIKSITDEVSLIGNPPNPPLLSREVSIARTNAYTHLCEARFWLGFELARIKEESK